MPIKKDPYDEIIKLQRALSQIKDYAHYVLEGEEVFLDLNVCSIAIQAISEQIKNLSI